MSGKLDPAWRSHPNAGGPTSMLLAIHDHFRAASEHLTRVHPTGDARALARVFIPLAHTLHHHHHAEEAMLFPLVHRRTGIAPAQLQADHDDLVLAIAEVEAALRDATARPRIADAITRFHEVLLAHLDREEALVVPVLLELTPAEAWGSLHAG
jgi:iron-sulfur cluster repair protein YtfE (RIC family)